MFHDDCFLLNYLFFVQFQINFSYANNSWKFLSPSARYISFVSLEEPVKTLLL